MTFPIRTTGEVTPIRFDTYERAAAIAMSFGDDWQLGLAAAQTLSRSQIPMHRGLARHVQDAYELHRLGLLKPATQRKTLPPIAPAPRPKATLRLDDWAVICGGAFAAVMTVTALFAPWIWR